MTVAALPPGVTLPVAMQAIVRAVESARMPLTDEKATQADLAAWFARAAETAGLAFEREVRLTPRDIPDFLFAGGIAVEVKLRGAGKAAVARQLRRYAEHPRVAGLVLASNTAMRVPDPLCGKPTLFASLGRGWL